MSRSPAQSTYTERLLRVIDHINRHLDDDVSIDTLAAIACFSRFHFQRQFSQFFGISLSRYIHRLKLRRASFALAFNPEQKITDIAFEAGYSNSESFSRSFKRTVGQSPSAFRNQPIWEIWQGRLQLPESSYRNPAMNIKIMQFSETPIAVFEHLGPPERIMESVQQLIAWRKETQLSPIKTARTFGIAYSDPEHTAADAFRFDLCAEVKAPVPDNAYNIVNKVIPSGRCAVKRHIGSPENLAASIYPIYRDWLPNSGEELRDFPLFFHYVTRMPDVAEHEQITDIYLPLQS